MRAYDLVMSMKFVSVYVLLEKEVDSKIFESLLNWLNLDMMCLNMFISVDYRLLINNNFSLLGMNINKKTDVLEVLVYLKEVTFSCQGVCETNTEALTVTCTSFLKKLIGVYDDLGQLGKLLQIFIESTTARSGEYDATLGSYFSEDGVYEVFII